MSISTATSNRQHEETPPEQPEGVAVFYGTTWEQFQGFDALFGERRSIRFTYLNGVTEVMAPIGRHHERKKKLLAELLELYLRDKKIRFYSDGSASLSKSGQVSVEPDESYCLNRDKPRPDLVIEVIISSGSIDKLELYRVLEIPEVWFWRDGNISVHVLEEAGYRDSARSALLPELDIAFLAECSRQDDQYDAVESFRRALEQDN